MQMTSTKRETNVPVSKTVKGTGTANAQMNEKPSKPSFTKMVQAVLNLPRDAFYKVSWYYPGGRQAFPLNPKMWVVDRYYPHANPPILCDIVILAHKKEEAKLKHEYFKSQGMMYVALERGAAIIDFDGDLD